jgi:uncharacterized protein YvpB
VAVILPPARRADHLTPAIGRAGARARRTTALLVVVAVMNTVGGSGLLYYSRSPFVVQARASALQARWTEMVTQGVPASDLAALRQEWVGAQGARLLAVWSLFWLPDSSAIVDRWQVQTEAIWGRNLSVSRASAVAAGERLHAALGDERVVQMKDRLKVLEAASTPADFLSLSSDWDLETILVPIDREIAARVGKVTDVSLQARAIGIATEPARAVLARAYRYVYEGPRVQSAHAAQLLSDLTRLKDDIRDRVAAATITTDGFTRAARELTLVKSYGVNVSKYRAALDADHTAYSTATTVVEFKAITGDVSSINAKLHHVGLVALAAMHTAGNDLATYIIRGVAMYYQRHALSCEETATSMGLVHQGLHISQDQILARLGVDWTPARLVNGRVVRWGNPDRAFVGNVNGSESNYTGQQANPKALVRVLKSYGARIIEWSEPGVGPNVINAQEIYKQVRAGHPVVAYATWDWNWHRIYYYRSEDGNRVPLISPANDHVYLVVGVSQTRVLVNDPIRGQYWVSKGAFQASYEFGMAIVLA